jgi:diguanylate cyclase (GGDEF)-like protein
MIVAWFVGRRAGLLFSVLASLFWFSADYFSGHVYSNPLFYFWNTAIRLAFFVIVVLLLSALQNALENEKALARMDRLTGAMNGDFFYFILQSEIDLQQRYKGVFTLAYLDLDNFKNINDEYGHLTGDQLLRQVVYTIRNNTRRTDVVARLGGDEFCILLRKTDIEEARVVISRIQQALLAEMDKNQWKVTFSIGVVTVESPVKTTDELIKMADDLMYAVKRAGKNDVSYLIHSKE